jgi:hypothetical protein
MSNVAQREGRGSLAYENWRAAVEGSPERSVLEYPLFTDAVIRGTLPGNYGPYQIIKTMPRDEVGRLLPALVLRMAYHTRAALPSLERTDVERYHGGIIQDEIASLISLCMGIRLQAGGLSRLFEMGEDPKGHPAAWESDLDPILTKPAGRHPILPQAIDEHVLDGAVLLAKLPEIPPEASVALVRAARLYQDALWIVESEPELSWIMLVSAIETAAGHWRKTTDSPLERMRTSRPDLEHLLLDAGGEELALRVAEQIADFMGAGKKFIDFLVCFLPDPPAERSHDFRISWEERDLRRAFRTIYGWRSRALHGGIPFPMPMCEAPRPDRYGMLNERPQSNAIGTMGGTWTDPDIPMLIHTFEYIVRRALLNWWMSMTPDESAEPAAGAPAVAL